MPYGEDGRTMKTLKLTKYFSLVGGICALLLGAFYAVLTVFRDGTRPLPAYILTCGLILLGAVCVLYMIAVLGGVFWRIRYNDVGFVYRNVYGRQVKVRYSDIRRIRRTDYVVYLYDQKRRFTVYLEADGSEDFLKTISGGVAVTEG